MEGISPVGQLSFQPLTLSSARVASHSFFPLVLPTEPGCPRKYRRFLFPFRGVVLDDCSATRGLEAAHTRIFCSSLESIDSYRSISELCRYVYDKCPGAVAYAELPLTSICRGLVSSVRDNLNQDSCCVHSSSLSVSSVESSPRTSAIVLQEVAPEVGVQSVHQTKSGKLH